MKLQSRFPEKLAETTVTPEKLASTILHTMATKLS
jgi:hypothetical protein